MVGKAILHSRFVRAALAAILGTCLVLAGGCVSAEYAAISLKPGAAAADLQDLARRAQGGDKRAQYELGLRYEVGDGIPRSPSRARILYTAAAADSGGTRMMFVPQRNGSVSTVPVNSGALVPGLPEARAALAGLEADTRKTAPYQEPKTRSQSVTLKQARGTLEFIDVSSLCEQHLEAIQRLSDWHIAKCRSSQYRLTKKNGQSLDLFDLFLVTDDSDAIEDIPIPFGLLDPFINSPSLDDYHARVPGAVSYFEIVTDSGVYNIISSFSEREK